jgi:hypothetical protein
VKHRIKQLIVFIPIKYHGSKLIKTKVRFEPIHHSPK